MRFMVYFFSGLAFLALIAFSWHSAEKTGEAKPNAEIERAPASSSAPPPITHSAAR